MERKVFLVFCEVLPIISLLFLFDNLHEVVIFVQGLSIIVGTFLYRNSDVEERKIMYEKAGFILVVIII